MRYSLTALIAFCLCFFLTPIIRRLAHHRGWLAYPVKDRWHQTPTALMGGMAIYLAMALPLWWPADFGGILDYLFKVSKPQPLPSMGAAIWIGISLMFVLGLIDDFISIKPHTKLLGQFLVASLMAYLGFRLQWFVSMTLDTMITIIWIVGVTNAFNLIDNMDGLCAGVGAVAALYLAFLLRPCSPELTLIAAAVAGSLAAFLVYNFNPASIFMGDCGSLPVGFALAMLGLSYSQLKISSTLSGYAVPVMILMVPILDTAMVTLIRLLSGRKASVGGRDHTSHRLVLLGFSEKGAVSFLYGVGAISGVAAVFVSRTDTLTSPAVIIPLILSLLLMAVYLAQIRVYPEREFCLLRGQPYTPVLMELTYKRQIVLVMLDFCLIAFSYYLSFRLRFGFEDFVKYFHIFLHSLPAVIAIKYVVFFITGVYRGIWRYMSTDDVFIHLKASFFATLFCLLAITFIYGFTDFSQGIFLIDWLLTTGLLLGTRGSFRISADAIKRRTLAGDRVLIYGAGRGGEILLREIINNKKHHIQPVGFIDDDILKAGKKLQGYPILGSFDDIERLFEQYQFNGVLVSFNGKYATDLPTLKKFCINKNLFVRRFSIKLEPVDLEDISD